jgi:hypothetical protein
MSPTAAAEADTSPVKHDEASDSQIADFINLSFTAVRGIDAAIGLLNARKVAPSANAQELGIIEYELGDQIAKKARIFAVLSAFNANARAMRPPSDEMIKDAKKHAAVLDAMVAANIVAQQIVLTATSLFKIWRSTEA